MISTVSLFILMRNMANNESLFELDLFNESADSVHKTNDLFTNQPSCSDWTAFLICLFVLSDDSI